MSRGGTAVGLWALMAFGGCIGSFTNPETIASTIATDKPLSLVDASFFPTNSVSAPIGALSDTAFHTTAEIDAIVHGWQEKHPQLVHVRSIGKTIENRDIWLASITDPAAAGFKPVAFLDGGHHANEYEGIEAVLYVGEFLLGNLDNASVRAILRDTEVVLVPLVNPDGHSAQGGATRGNALGVNLNRNYDLDWGNPLGASNPVMGTLAHKTGKPMPSVSIVAENCGDAPFSEPETRAMRDAINGYGPRLAFYVTHHTNAHSVSGHWGAQDPPFEIPENEGAVIDATLQWVRENTEFLAGRTTWGDFSAGLPYSASGSSKDWVYANWRVPSFTFEQAFGPTAILSPSYVDRTIAADPGTEYWMKAGLPIEMKLLSNAPLLRQWKLPSIDVVLPAGVPPTPAAGMDDAGCLCIV